MKRKTILLVAKLLTIFLVVIPLSYFIKNHFWPLSDYAYALTCLFITVALYVALDWAFNKSKSV